MIELLVVIAVIAILAGLLFPVFAQAKEAAKGSSCLSNVHSRGIALSLYVSDFDGAYPQTRTTSADPSVDDAGGELEEPDFGPTERLLSPYSGDVDSHSPCPSDPDPRGKSCDGPYPDHPDLDSYITNGWFAFGLRESAVKAPSQTIYWAERRSEASEDSPPYCNYLYRPWFNSSNPKALEDDMANGSGAIATKRHDGRQNFGFLDGHSARLSFVQTFDLASGVNMHRP